MNAPVCPVTRSQAKIGTAGAPGMSGTAPTLLPSIPIATDLPSLIRAVNIINDILRTITTSLTVNNTYLPQQPRPPKIPPNKTYNMSPYPGWYEVGTDTDEGMVFYKTKDTIDEKNRAYIYRTKEVEFRNRYLGTDASFYWKYVKALDSTSGEHGSAPPFKESFFERVVNVHWAGGLAVDFGEHTANSTVKNEKQ